MGFVTTLLIAAGLAMDAFAVSLGAGTSHQSDNTRSRLRLSFHFGFFQAFMPVLGWLAGSSIDRFISSIDHWIAVVLLAYVGGKMIREGISAAPLVFSDDPSRGKNLVILSIATSIDALAVGLSLSMLKVQIVAPAVIIGVVTFCLSLLGLLAGNYLGNKFGKVTQVLGGVILIGIGLRVLITHLFLA
jgi:putative Mn2+ efflux pump MntP